MRVKNRPHEQGMTLIEVAIALAVFSIGLVFLIKADQVTQNYAIQSEERQQAVYTEYGELGLWINGGATDPSITIGNRTYNITVSTKALKSTTLSVNGSEKTVSLEYGTVSVSLPGSAVDSSLPKLVGYRIVVNDNT